MRIAHVTTRARRVGGAEAHVLALAAAQAARGDHVTVVHADDAPDLPAGVDERRRNGRPLSGNDFDIVHVHGSEEPAGDAATVRSLHDFSFGCASGERWFRDGSVCTRVHGPGCLVGLGVRGCGHRLDLRPPLRSYRALGRSLPRLASAHAVVVYSAFVHGLAVRSGVEAGRCHAIPYFVERPSAPPPPAETRSVAFVGRLTANKGLDVLLEALSLRPDAWDDLTVVGDGWDRGRCEELARKLGIAGRVTFAGWLPAADVQAALRGAAVVAVPSRWPEPFGIVGLEAMAAARPVVASRIGGIAEWLDDGETGVLVEPGDADALAAGLATVLSDPARARRLGEEAWRKVAAFSPAAHLAALDVVYAGVRR